MIRPIPTTRLVVAQRFRLDFPLGEGGFGAVWRATELLTGELAAVKILKGGLDRVGLTRFEREAEALARMDHPHCVKLLAFGYDDAVQGPYLATEYVDGESLAAWAQRGYAVEVIVDVVAQIASALDAAHRRGIVHRDLKPPNVMIVRGDAGPVVKVLDFGIAKMLGVEGGDVTRTGEVIGTPGYMSPEQLRGERDLGPATDSYCLGAVLFRLLEGRPVFEGTTALEIAMKHLTDEPPPLRRPVPPRVSALVTRLLAKRPADRPTAREARGELLAVLGRSEPAAAVELRHEPARSRSPASALVGVLALVVGGGVMVWALSPAEPPPPQPRALKVVLAPPPEPKPRPEPRPAAAPPPAPTATPQRRSAGCDAAVPRAGGVARKFTVEIEDADLPDITTQREFELPSYLPHGYDPRHAYPVLVILDNSDAYQVVDGTLFANIADEHRVVIFRPLRLDMPLRDEMYDPVVALDAWEAFRAFSRAVCLDLDDVFLVGTEGGGRGAEYLACEVGPIAGVITRAHRYNEGERRCRPNRPIPHLALFPTQDPRNPVNGGLGTDRERPAASIDAQERRSLELNGCTEPSTKTRYGEGVCLTWGCAAHTVSCRLKRGPRWPDYPDSIRASPEFPRAADAPYEAMLWDFIVKVRPELSAGDTRVSDDVPNSQNPAAP